MITKVSQGGKAFVTLGGGGGPPVEGCGADSYTRGVEPSKVLVIEDDPEIVGLLKLHLGDLGLDVEAARGGAEALELIHREHYALILLDIMLPQMDGLEVCRRIRQEDRSTPILMLTAKSEELDKVLGLELGADDYVTKPFSVRELMARVKALLRRAEDGRHQSAAGAEGVRGADGSGRGVLSFGELRLDAGKRLVTVSNQPVDLTTKEFDMLLLLCRHPGQAFSRKQLLESVWGYNYEGYSHTVNSHINRLRSKIEPDPSNPRYVETVWGFGYRFADNPEA